MGKYAIDLLNEKLGTEFPEDEAGFIALHFVNAEYNTTINDTFGNDKYDPGDLRAG